MVLTYYRVAKPPSEPLAKPTAMWDSMVGKRCVHVHASLLEWMGYENYNNRDKKRDFIKLLESNEIEYKEIGFKDSSIEEQFPKIQEEIDQTRPIDKPRQ